MAVMIAGAAVAAVGLITDFIGSSKAASAAKRAAMKASMAEAKATAERIRQLKQEEKTLRGQTVATVAGSGIKVDSTTPLMVYAEQAKEFAYQRKITKQLGASKSAAILQSGKDTATAYRFQAYANLAKGASSVFSMAASSGRFSTGAPPTAAQGGTGQ